MIKVNGEPVREFRCKACRRLLGYEYIYAGRLQIVCPRCKETNDINFRTTKAELTKIIQRR